MKKKFQFKGLNGAMDLPPENTLESIQKTLDFGAKCIELSVHLCDSGEPVVMQGSAVDETTNGMGDVEDFTLEELKKLRIDGQYQIPSLKEALNVIDGQAKVVIQLAGFGTARVVSSIIQKYVRTDNWKRKMFLVTSFNWFELLDYYTIDQKTKIGILTQKLTKDAIKLAKTIKATSIHPKKGKYKEKHLKTALKKGFKIKPWVSETEVFETAPNLKEVEIMPIVQSSKLKKAAVSALP